MKDAEPNGAVRFHQGVLGVGQRAGFAEDLCRYRNLANVVDSDCGQTKNLKSLRAQSEPCPNRDGQIGNAILVLDREWIPVTVGGRKNRDTLGRSESSMRV